MKILVVEDDLLIATFVAMTLTDRGHQVVGPTTTQTGGLALAHQHLPEFALLDIDLGVGGCGVALARNLYDELGIFSLFVSASIGRARTARDVALGVLSKPWSGDTLESSLAACSDVMAGRRPGRLPAGLELFRLPIT